MNNAPAEACMGHMMEAMGGMMWGMGLLWLLLVVLLALGSAALIKYLFFGQKRANSYG